MFAALLPMLGTLLEKIIPDPKAAAEAKLKMLEMAQNGELAFLDAAKAEAAGQVAINVEEAKSESFFKSGWRPFVGWVCAVSVAYPLARAVLPWLVQSVGLLFGHDFGVAAMPAMDTTETLQLLLGMLGLGSLRTFEKLKGVN